MCFRFLRAILILATLSANAGSQTDTLAATIEQNLRGQYQGKIFLLRNFLTGDHLYYNLSGSPIGSNVPGDWTADGFVMVNDVQLRQQSLMLEARRLLVVSLNHKFQFRPAERSLPGAKEEKEPVSVEITIDLGPNTPSAEAAEALTSKVFLSGQDSLADLVPTYWKSCIRSGLNDRHPACRFSSEILAIQGVLPSERPQLGLLAIDPSSDAPKGSFLVGNGVSPPKQIYAPEPEFSDAARGVKFQGIVVVALIVNAEGVPTAVHILSPLGAGLDAKAVQAVKSWKFKPAEKDGQPVAVTIAVQVDFHLY